MIGLSFLFTKIALTVDDPLNILAHRFTISFFALLIPVLFGWIKLKNNIIFFPTDTFRQ
ncbi:MAG: hypothetical protein ACERKZ_18595 [Lachnotalea sp.]